ncbi:MAG: lysophospholipid acyltransferase family protein [Myxococcota bacterium]
MKPTPPRPALGSDPFTNSDGTLPYLIRLREHIIHAVSENGEPIPRPHERKTPRTTPDLGPPIPDVPTFDDPDEAASWIDQLAGVLLDRRDEERLAALAASLGAHPYDRLGLSARTARRALAVFKLIYRYYFRVESSGHQVIPEKGGAIIAANHGGLLPFDAAMAIVDIFLKAEPPRLLRSVVDRWAGTLPFVNVFYARVGQVIGTRDNFRELLRDEQIVLVFPEGLPAIRKKAAERYVLQSFRVGFIEESMRNRVPIIPAAIVGPDDQAPILYDLKPLARLLGLPVLPITPTFPWLGPLGLLPYPVKYEIRYGEPFRFFEEFPAKSCEDPHAVRYMAEQVRRRIQEIVDQRVLARRGAGS